MKTMTWTKINKRAHRRLNTWIYLGILIQYSVFRPGGANRYDKANISHG
jgi:hypothetical protein